MARKRDRMELEEEDMDQQLRDYYKQQKEEDDDTTETSKDNSR